MAIAFAPLVKHLQWIVKDFSNSLLKVESNVPWLRNGTEAAVVLTASLSRMQ
jgi:hypothetical protein